VGKTHSFVLKGAFIPRGGGNAECALVHPCAQGIYWYGRTLLFCMAKKCSLRPENIGQDKKEEVPLEAFRERHRLSAEKRRTGGCCRRIIPEDFH
jgi:hypothetical protein